MYSLGAFALCLCICQCFLELVIRITWELWETTYSLAQFPRNTYSLAWEAVYKISFEIKSPSDFDEAMSHLGMTHKHIITNIFLSTKD